MVFEGVDLTPDDGAQMKRIKARVAIEETIRVMMEKGADDEAIEKATLARTQRFLYMLIFRSARGRGRCRTRQLRANSTAVGGVEQQPPYRQLAVGCAQNN